MAIYSIGIDPGKTGALLVLNGFYRVISSIRTDEKFVSEGIYLEDQMASYLRDLCQKLGEEAEDMNVVRAFVERQHAMPGQGGTSMFTVGEGFGLWKGVLAGVGIPHQIVRAAEWQKEILKGYGKADDKDKKAAAKAAASSLLPGFDLCPGALRKPHSGLADAACIAVYGLTKLQATGGRIL